MERVRKEILRVASQNLRREYRQDRQECLNLNKTGRKSLLQSRRTNGDNYFS